jgi:hypothetical protein
MASFGRSDDLRGSTFRDVDLTAARFDGCDLSGAVLRGVQVEGVEIDAPWLFEGAEGLRVNGVDVTAYVDAELDRRFPGRSERRAPDPQGLRAAWAALERTWAATVRRAEAMPDGTVDVSVAGEWSFAQTLRHLVLATDMWLGRAILQEPQPFHPLGLADASLAEEDVDVSIFAAGEPTYADVLDARAGRVALVRGFLAGVTDEQLDETRANPHDPDDHETVRSCLHVILDEEWEHHRYAVRDLDAIQATSS